MLQEREIPDEWMWRTIEEPDRTEAGADGNTHYIKAIPEHGGRFLRVIVNENVEPGRVVTLFFAGDLVGNDETQGGQGK